jgi:hypothetical protein
VFREIPQTIAKLYMNKLNIFYEEPSNDRWFKYDRYPRAIIRRMVRGPEPIGGVKKWFINLIKGLDELNIPYQINNYRALRKNKNEWALVVGKDHVLDKIPAHTQIIYGPGLVSHPLDLKNWETKKNIKHILAPCKWMKDMFDRDLPVNIPVSVWPSGVETDIWTATPVRTTEPLTLLVYDKIRWERDKYSETLLQPILNELKSRNIQVEYIKYGDYEEENFHKSLDDVDGMIFLCEHETQGFAYLQTLSTNTPILAWDRGGYWQDPTLYPDTVKFEPVTSVPYWSEKCGEKFQDFEEFKASIDTFLTQVKANYYQPRQFVLENLTLAARSKDYVDQVHKIIKG